MWKTGRWGHTYLCSYGNYLNICFIWIFTVPAGPPSCPHTRVRAGASGPLVPRVPGWRRAPQGLGRGPLGPAAASLARERCQVSCLVPESLPGPWSGISRSSSGPKPSTSTLGGGVLFPPTIPGSFLLSCGKGSSPFSLKGSIFPFQLPLHFSPRRLPVGGKTLPSIFS